jgi:hypothetical protein
MLQVIKCVYIQHIQGLCPFRLSTADHALSLVALATTLRTARQSIGFWLLNVADREPIIWLLRHALFQSTIHFSGAMFLLTIGPKCFV